MKSHVQIVSWFVRLSTSLERERERERERGRERVCVCTLARNWVWCPSYCSKHNDPCFELWLEVWDTCVLKIFVRVKCIDVCQIVVIQLVKTALLRWSGYRDGELAIRELRERVNGKEEEKRTFESQSHDHAARRPLCLTPLRLITPRSFTCVCTHVCAYHDLHVY